MAEPIAFLLHGFLGSGKTKFAKQLEQDQNAVRFTHDEWMRRLYRPYPPETDYPLFAARMFSVMDEIWTRCLDLKTNVILDFGFWSRAERDWVRNLVAAHGGKSMLYRVSCSDDVAWSRLEQRNNQPESIFLFTPEIFQLLKSRVEPLEADEDYIEAG